MRAEQDLEKITLALSFLAYEGDEQEISKQQMNQNLEKYERWIGKCQTVWGPAYHKNRPPVLHDLKREQKVDAMTYIVQDSTPANLPVKREQPKEQLNIHYHPVKSYSQ